MTASRPSLRWIIGALCLALLVLRVGGVHLHLCFDGSEPPVSYHVADSGIHHDDEHAAGETHSDRDLAIAEDVLVKKPASGQDALLLAFTLALLLFLVARRREVSPRADDPQRPPDAFPWLRPPLRGPPSLA